MESLNEILDTHRTYCKKQHVITEHSLLFGALRSFITAGYPDVAALFRSTAEGETGHAFGHMEFLKEECGDPATGARKLLNSSD